MSFKQDMQKHYWNHTQHIKDVVGTNLLKFNSQSKLNLDLTQLQSLVTFVNASIDEASSGYTKEFDRCVENHVSEDSKKK
jgi:hypothetical protein